LPWRILLHSISAALLISDIHFLNYNFDLCSPLVHYADKIHIFCSEWRPRDCAFNWTTKRRWTAGAGGDILLQCMRSIKIVKSTLKSWFFAISPDFNDFTRFQPDFTYFRFFQTIQHVKHVLTRKIVRFYESKRDFNNLALSLFISLQSHWHKKKLNIN
jgi:hypothetical protein